MTARSRKTLADAKDESGSMTDPANYETILTVIESAIKLTRQNPRSGEPTPSDDYTAWVILQELRRAGWTIIRS
jgi:hypothetical protein